MLIDSFFVCFDAYKKLESPRRLRKVGLKSPAPMHFPL